MSLKFFFGRVYIILIEKKESYIYILLTVIDFLSFGWEFVDSKRLLEEVLGLVGY